MAIFAGPDGAGAVREFVAFCGGDLGPWPRRSDRELVRLCETISGRAGGRFCCTLLHRFGPIKSPAPSPRMLPDTACFRPLAWRMAVREDLAFSCGDSGRGRQRSYWILLGNPRPRPSEEGLQKLAAIGPLCATLETCQNLHLFRPPISCACRTLADA
jgi:hypothetical protein